jgi:hypothetical protein
LRNGNASRFIWFLVSGFKFHPSLGVQRSAFYR